MSEVRLWFSIKPAYFFFFGFTIIFLDPPIFLLSTNSTTTTLLALSHAFPSFHDAGPSGALEIGLPPSHTHNLKALNSWEVLATCLAIGYQILPSHLMLLILDFEF
jgi:hypothetical protein